MGTDEKEKLFKDLYDAIVIADTDKALSAARKLVYDFHVDVQELMNRALLPAMKHVGELYERGEYFIADMAMSADTFNAIMKEIIEPILSSNKETSGSSKRIVAVFGTVQGDIHELGKNLAKAYFMANGIDVVDLGVDVPAEKFVEAVKQYNAVIVGASALMTTTREEQKAVIEALRKAGLRDKVIFIAGGAPVTDEWVKEIEADVNGSDMFKAFEKVKELLRARGYATS
jgi:5-methyltetrahydrofolate--homocysteine methyltransferase